MRWSLASAAPPSFESMRHITVLGLDLGTSGVKIALVDENLTVTAVASRPYAMYTDEPGQAEQYVGDWTAGIISALAELGDAVSEVAAVSLTGQMPTLVTLDDTGAVLGPAITWQDSRADDLIKHRLSEEIRDRVARVSGAPIDGRYLGPMHLRRGGPAATLLSARDYLFYWLTGDLATDPSTASGYGVYDLETSDWSRELCGYLDLDPALLPPVVPPTHHAPLRHDRLPGIAIGTPVVLGGADSVSAHHWIERCTGEGVSIIDGSSTVILASFPERTAAPRGLLVTPLVEAGRFGVELDLLATGSSISWLARLLGRSPKELEALALGHPDPVNCAAVALPYLAGGEQGALWRTDLTGTLAGLTLATTPADLALALFEGIAFETWRCLTATRLSSPCLTTVATTDSALLRPAILAGLSNAKVSAVREASSSVLGAALLAFEALEIPTAPATRHEQELPHLSPHYRAALPERLRRYLANAPALAATER